VGKVFAMDIWSLEVNDRWRTVIIVGVALGIVSVLYARFKETIRQYL
jgi:hypothetical protein